VVFQTGNPIDVDYPRGRGEAKFEHGDQALASGQNFGLSTILIKNRNSFFNRSGCVVGKSGWVHSILFCFSDRYRGWLWAWNLHLDRGVALGAAAMGPEPVGQQLSETQRIGGRPTPLGYRQFSVSFQ
jgi:hypothetical protein